MIRVVANVEVNAPAERIVALTSDMGKLPAWVPGVTSAEVLAREGDISVVELNGPRFHGGRLVLECVRTSPEEVVFAEVDRWRGRGFSGSVSVRPGSAGGRCDLRVAVERDGTILNVVGKRRLQNTVDELVSEVARRAERLAANELELTSGRRKIMEIVRRDGRLYVHVEGSSVELPLDGPAVAS